MIGAPTFAAVMAQARASEDLCGFCHCPRAGHIAKGVGQCRMHRDDNPLHCERFMDPADFALTSVEEQAREKVERKQADEMDEAHIEASFRVLHGRASASARFADQVRACLHGHPQLLGPVFDLVRIAERE